MRIIVTGAAGFVGRELLSQIDGDEWVAIDSSDDDFSSQRNITRISGDLNDEAVLCQAFADGCDAVVHLATVPGGAAEQLPGLARQVNVSGTMLLAEYAAKTGRQPRFIFASSIAAFGNPLPSRVDDMTPVAPKLYYGAHKAMMEVWFAALSRRGEIDALSLRLPGVIARPKGPSGMKSAFLSDVFHSMRAGQHFVMPVSPDATCWLTSVRCAAQNFHHAIRIDLAGAPIDRCVNLPMLRVRIVDLVNELAEQTGNSGTLVSFEPDAEIESAFAEQPPIQTDCANKMGFTNDGDLRALVASALKSTAQSL